MPKFVSVPLGSGAAAAEEEEEEAELVLAAITHVLSKNKWKNVFQAR